MKVLAASSELEPNVIHGGGIPKKTSNAKDGLLKMYMKKNPWLTTSKLKSFHPELLSTISVRTIQYRLHNDLRLPSREVARKLLINHRMKKQRMSFVKKYTHWTPQQWRMGFLSILWDGYTKLFCNLYWIVRTLMVLSSSGWKIFNSETVNRGFFFSYIYNRRSAAFDVFFGIPPPWITLGSNSDDAASTFMMVDFALPVPVHAVS